MAHTADPFVDVWEVVQGLFENNPGLEAKTVFEHLQRVHPGRFQDGQVRALQRKVKYTSCVLLVQDLLAAIRDLRPSKEIKKLALMTG